jgi:hypothetical protein
MVIILQLTNSSASKKHLELFKNITVFTKDSWNSSASKKHLELFKNNNFITTEIHRSQLLNITILTIIIRDYNCTFIFTIILP